MRRAAALLLCTTAFVGSAAAERKLVVAADPAGLSALRGALAAGGFSLIEAGEKVDADARAGVLAGQKAALATVWMTCGAANPSRIRGTSLAGATVQCRAVATAPDGQKLEGAAVTVGGAGRDAAAAAAAAIANAGVRAGRVLAAALDRRFPAPAAPEAAGVIVVVTGSLDWRSLGALMGGLSVASGDKGKKSPPELRRVSAGEVRFRARTGKSAPELAAALTRVPQDIVTVKASVAQGELRVVLAGETEVTP